MLHNDKEDQGENSLNRIEITSNTDEANMILIESFLIKLNGSSQIMVYFHTRVVLGLLSAVTEAYFYKSVQGMFGGER